MYSPRQTDVLRIVSKSILENGFAPTIQEIADQLGVAKVTAFESLTALEKKGAIRRKQMQSRSIRILDKDFIGPDKDELLTLLRDAVAGKDGWKGRAASALDSLEEFKKEQAKLG